MFSENVWPWKQQKNWTAVETEVSPSNFIFTAENIVCYPPEVPPAEKMKFERLTFAWARDSERNGARHRFRICRTTGG
jgi:hypothetical protein